MQSLPVNCCKTEIEINRIKYKTMKTKLIRIFALLIIILQANSIFAVTQTRETVKKKVKTKGNDTVLLFNGKDLNNWVFKLKDPSVDPSTVFNFKKGVIHISGNPFGYMRTKESYSEYKLHVEWRWPVEASNSGVFIHAQQPDTIWLKCIECQLQAGNAGDFICANGADMDERTDKSKKLVKKLAASSEKEIGEWNTMEVVCKANTIEVWVNGVRQNRGTNVTLSKGSICLQSEGKDVEFRDVYLNKLVK